MVVVIVMLVPALVLTVVLVVDVMDPVVQGIVVVMLDEHGLIVDDVFMNDHGVRPDSPLPVWHARVHDDRRRAHDHSTRNGAGYRATPCQANENSR